MYVKRCIVAAAFVLVLIVAGAAQADVMIGVHWSDYAGNGASPITGTDGVMPQTNWNNVSTNWYSGSASGLKDSTGATTGVAVTVNATGAGTTWWVSGPSAGLSNLLVGPWGGNGPRANVITGIPFAQYDIIAYVNQPYGGHWNVGLDSNPTASNAANARTNVHYFTETGSAPGFVEITNTDSALFPAGNYVKFTGLTGGSQTLWLDGNGDNRMISGFQIVQTPEPATMGLLILGAVGLIRRRRTA